MIIGKTYRFEAAHALKGWPETHPCHRVHGHSYKVEVELEGPTNPETFAVMDFALISLAWSPIYQRVDHQYLNEVFSVENCTAEFLAITFFSLLNDNLPRGPMLRRVRVWETETAYAEVIRDERGK